MSGEGNPVEPRDKPVPFDTVLHNSFLTSQGDPELQTLIFYYLLFGPLKNQRATLKTFPFREGIITRHVQHMAKEKRHVAGGELEGMDSDILETEIEERDVFRLVLQEIESAEREGKGDELREAKYTSMVHSFIERDLEWYDRGGRPVKQDRWASFLIDFCIFKTGMKRAGFKYKENLLPAFKQLCDEVGSRLMGGQILKGEAEDVLILIDIYLEHHPRLSQRRKAELVKIHNILKGKFQIA